MISARTPLFPIHYVHPVSFSQKRKTGRELPLFLLGEVLLHILITAEVNGSIFYDKNPDEAYGALTIQSVYLPRIDNLEEESNDLAEVILLKRIKEKILQDAAQNDRDYGIIPLNDPDLKEAQELIEERFGANWAHQMVAAALCR